MEEILHHLGSPKSGNYLSSFIHTGNRPLPSFKMSSTHALRMSTVDVCPAAQVLDGHMLLQDLQLYSYEQKNLSAKLFGTWTYMDP